MVLFSKGRLPVTIVTIGPVFTLVAASAPDPAIEYQVVQRELSELMKTVAIPLSMSEAWVLWERRVRELLYRLYRIARRSTTPATVPLALMMAESSTVELSLVVSPLLALATVRTSTDPVFAEGCRAAAAAAKSVTTFAAWLAYVDEVKATQLVGQLPDLLNLLTTQRSYPALTASASPLPVPAVPGMPVGAVAAASTPSADPWLRFPAPPCGIQLFNFVLVDQGCGVGFVTPDWTLFDRRLALSDVKLSGFDGSVRTSTRTPHGPGKTTVWF